MQPSALLPLPIILAAILRQATARPMVRAAIILGAWINPLLQTLVSCKMLSMGLPCKEEVTGPSPIWGLCGKRFLSIGGPALNMLLSFLATPPLTIPIFIYHSVERTTVSILDRMGRLKPLTICVWSKWLINSRHAVLRLLPSIRPPLVNMHKCKPALNIWQPEPVDVCTLWQMPKI